MLLFLAHRDIVYTDNTVATKKNVYSAVITARPLQEFTQLIWLKQTQYQAAAIVVNVAVHIVTLMALSVLF